MLLIFSGRSRAAEETLFAAGWGRLAVSCFGASLSSNVQPSVLISTCQDPFVNLSFEDWLYRRSDPANYLLFLYRNRASVIIGRNQNPWTELDMQKLKELGLPFVRRRSGGGTVYHVRLRTMNLFLSLQVMQDLGNTNYCLLSPRDLFKRKVGADMVTCAIRKLQIPAYVNERHDICVEQFKVSGSAFKIGSKRAYHHGTMLIDAALHDLRGVLRNTKTRIESKAIASVSSPVRNLEEWSAMIDHASFVDGVAHEFLDDFADGQGHSHLTSEQHMLSIEEVSKGAEELQTWDWLYGQTPEFSHDMSYRSDSDAIDFCLTARKGLITSISVRSANDDNLAGFLEQNLVGDRYGTIEKTIEAAQSNSPAVRRAVDWLLREM